jgi:sugar lactone lactonase YvrE
VPSLLNDLAFDRRGNLYVTDSLANVIYRVRPDDGHAEHGQARVLEPWLVYSRPGVAFGLNGVRVHPRRDELYFVVSLELDGGFAPHGWLYRVPLVDHPGDTDLRAVVDFGGALPDGIAFGASGDVYAVLAGANQVAVVRAPHGHHDAGEIVAMGPTPEQNARSSIPLDLPANIAFDGHGGMLIVNHALNLDGSADPAHFAVLRVDVNDPGARLFAPRLR